MRRHHEAVDLAGAQRGDRGPLARLVLVRVGEQHGVAAGLDDVGEAAGGRGEERVLDVADDEADDTGDARGERPRHGVGDVSQRARCRLDARPGLRADVAVAAERAPAVAWETRASRGDIVDGHGHATSHPSPRCGRLVALSGSH